jgi:N-acyl-D-amino-acid deacylase
MHCSILSVALLSTVMVPVARTQDLSPSSSQKFDVVIKNGTVYDGSGGEGHTADIALRGDRIAGVGDFKNAQAGLTIDAKGLAVAPGFINMLSWSTESLIADGRSQSEIRQGVTTEIMGEGESMGPVNDRVRD